MPNSVIAKFTCPAPMDDEQFYGICRKAYHEHGILTVKLEKVNPFMRDALKALGDQIYPVKGKQPNNRIKND